MMPKSDRRLLNLVLITACLWVFRMPGHTIYAIEPKVTDRGTGTPPTRPGGK